MLYHYPPFSKSIHSFSGVFSPLALIDITDNVSISCSLEQGYTQWSKWRKNSLETRDVEREREEKKKNTRLTKEKKHSHLKPLEEGAPLLLLRGIQSYLALRTLLPLHRTSASLLRGIGCACSLEESSQPPLQLLISTPQFELISLNRYTVIYTLIQYTCIHFLHIAQIHMVFRTIKHISNLK